VSAELDAPIFLVGGPESGADVVLLALAQAPGVLHATVASAESLADRDTLAAALVDLEGRTVEQVDGRVTPIVGGEAVAAAGVRQLAATWADARFVFVSETQKDPVPQEFSLLDREHRLLARYADLLAAPRGELRRLCASLGIRYDQALLAPLEEAARAAREPAGEEESPLRSVFTASFGAELAQLGSSLLVSTYQTGKLICARQRGGQLNTHFRDFDKPMGVAVADGRFCLGTRTEVWDLRDLPDVAPKLEPPGTHDACYLPRNRHVTGDVAVHEMAFAEGELWLVATEFSCLATLDAHHSFVPRWTPPFVSAITVGDRCHLNGLAVVDDRVRYVTALAQSDEPGGWRAHKADGGVVVDVPSSEVVAAGLSMPHSPRWHAERLWVLESGRGTLAVLDLDTGRAETVVELPGFTRGLAFAGGIAFVGLSQIRESSVFGGLPLVQRLEERLCGVWMVDIARGTVEGFLRFEDLVQEVFEVALLPGTSWPEVAEPDSSAVAASYVLP
jgi:uncharacterized protein (TIGR03032 family)